MTFVFNGPRETAVSLYSARITLTLKTSLKTHNNNNNKRNVILNEASTTTKCFRCVINGRKTVLYAYIGEDTKMRFNMKPGPGDSDFEQWQSAMKMVARLPDGVPHEFRNTVSARNKI